MFVSTQGTEQLQIVIVGEWHFGKLACVTKHKQLILVGIAVSDGFLEIPELKWNEFYILIDNELVDDKCTNINVPMFTTV